MQAVVAGVDLTTMGRRVADRARLVAESHGADLHLVHVLETVGEAMIEPDLARIMHDYQRGQAEKLAAWTQERTNIPVTLEVAKGSPSWELASRAKNAGILILGSSSIDAFRSGPTSLRVARKAVSDTLIIRRQPRVPYRRVIAAVDFSESSRAAVERATTQFPDSDITVLYSLPARFDPILAEAGLFEEEVEASREVRLGMAKEKMADFVAPYATSLRTLVVDGPPMETIDEVLRRRNADLLIVGNRGATATRMVLLGTIAEGLVLAAPCDVLVARSKSAFRRP